MNYTFFEVNSNERVVKRKNVVVWGAGDTSFLYMNAVANLQEHFFQPPFSLLSANNGMYIYNFL